MRYFGKNDQKDLWSDKMIKGTKTDFNSGEVSQSDHKKGCDPE